jgi:hypothetical protein
MQYLTHLAAVVTGAAADVNTPLGAHDIYDEEDFIIALTKLIASHLDITRWVFKLESAWQVCYSITTGNRHYDSALFVAKQSSVIVCSTRDTCRLCILYAIAYSALCVCLKHMTIRTD